MLRWSIEIKVWVKLSLKISSGRERTLPLGVGSPGETVDRGEKHAAHLQRPPWIVDSGDAVRLSLGGTQWLLLTIGRMHRDYCKGVVFAGPEQRIYE